MVIDLAGLAVHSGRRGRAARLDGGENAWQCFRNVTLPLLSKSRHAGVGDGHRLAPALDQI